MATRNLTLNINGNSNSATAALKSLNQHLQGMQSLMNKTQSSASTLSGSFGGLAVKAAAFGAAYKAIQGAVNLGRDLVNTYGEYEFVLARSEATLRASGEYSAQSFQAVTDEVRRLGATTMYSAAEAGQGLLALTQAGYSAEESIASLGTALNLAQAGDLSLDDATRVLVSTIAQFGGTAADSAKYADVLAAAASSSLADIGSMAESMKYAGVAGGALGLSVEEVAAALAALSQKGLGGSIGGAGLDRFFTELSSESRPAVKRLLALNSSLTFDKIDPANNKLLTILRNMKKAGVTANELRKVMEARGARAGGALLDGLDTKEGFRSMLSATSNAAGTTGIMADTMGDKWEAVSKRVRSAWQELNLTLAESIVPWLKVQAEKLSSTLLGLANTVKILKLAMKNGEGSEFFMSSVRLGGMKAMNAIVGYGLQVINILGAAFTAMWVSVAANSSFLTDMGKGMLSVLSAGAKTLTGSLVEAGAVFLGHLRAGLEQLFRVDLLNMMPSFIKTGLFKLNATNEQKANFEKIKNDNPSKDPWDILAAKAREKNALTSAADYTKGYMGDADRYRKEGEALANSGMASMQKAMEELGKGVNSKGLETEKAKEAWKVVLKQIEGLGGLKPFDESKVQAEFDTWWAKYGKLLPSLTKPNIGALKNKAKPLPIDEEESDVGLGGPNDGVTRTVTADSLQAIGGGTGGFFAYGGMLATLGSIEQNVGRIASGFLDSFNGTALPTYPAGSIDYGSLGAGGFMDAFNEGWNGLNGGVTPYTKDTPAMGSLLVAPVEKTNDLLGDIKDILSRQPVSGGSLMPVKTVYP